MALKHFLLTVPLSSVTLTAIFYWLVPLAGLQLNWYETLTVITCTNIAVTFLAVLLIPDGGRRHQNRQG
jgi:hypothetical protein